MTKEINASEYAGFLKWKKGQKEAKNGLDKGSKGHDNKLREELGDESDNRKQVGRGEEGRNNLDREGEGMTEEIEELVTAETEKPTEEGKPKEETQCECGNILTGKPKHCPECGAELNWE